jgi:hypothetical protein
MTAGEWAAVAGAAVAGVATLGLLIALASLTRTLRSLREAVDELRRETVPVVGDMHAAVRKANAELARVDGLLETAESIGSTVDSASRLAYLTFSNPVVKALAFASGTSRAWRRFRRTAE